MVPEPVYDTSVMQDVAAVDRVAARVYTPLPERSPVESLRSYAAEDEHAALIAQIKEERGGRLINLYKMLLNSPPVARGWLNLLTAVRQQCQLASRYRELAILRIAILNGADYEYVSHVPIGLTRSSWVAPTSEV